MRIKCTHSDSVAEEDAFWIIQSSCKSTVLYSPLASLLSLRNSWANFCTFELSHNHSDPYTHIWHFAIIILSQNRLTHSLFFCLQDEQNKYLTHTYTSISNPHNSRRWKCRDRENVATHPADLLLSLSMHTLFLFHQPQRWMNCVKCTF